jgi:hypothetical protein
MNRSLQPDLEATNCTIREFSIPGSLYKGRLNAVNHDEGLKTNAEHEYIELNALLYIDRRRSGVRD